MSTAAPKVKKAKKKNQGKGKSKKTIVVLDTGQPMIGTGGTVYTPIASYTTGRVGYADLEDGSFRVRVEPKNDTPLPFPTDWKPPKEGEAVKHYSVTVTGSANVAAAIGIAGAILLTAALPDNIEDADEVNETPVLDDDPENEEDPDESPFD